MGITQILGIVSSLAIVGGLVFLGLRMQANAADAYGAYLRDLIAKFTPVQLRGELAPVWACVGNETAGAIGVTDRRVVFATVSGFEFIELADIRSVHSVAKDFGGARTLPGFEITLERGDGRRHLLPVIDRAPYLPPEHDVAAVLARLGAS